MEIGYLKYFVIFVAVFGAVSDLFTKRIPNWFNFPIILTGILLAFFTGGVSGGLSSLLGIGLGFLLYSWLFFLGVMGGGDVKFLMALGSIGGGVFSIKVGLLGIIIGGVFAIIIMIFKGKLRDFYARILVSFSTIIIKDVKFISPEIDTTSKMPFGVPIALSAIWLVLTDYLVDPFIFLGW